MKKATRPEGQRSLTRCDYTTPTPVAADLLFIPLWGGVV